VATEAHAEHDRAVDEALELSTLLASLEDITKRVSSLVESSSSPDEVDSELIALERSLAGSLRRLRRAERAAHRRC
jgi:hypothetical protein